MWQSYREGLIIPDYLEITNDLIAGSIRVNSLLNFGFKIGMHALTLHMGGQNKSGLKLTCMFSHFILVLKINLD